MQKHQKQHKRDKSAKHGSPNKVAAAPKQQPVVAPKEVITLQELKTNNTLLAASSQQELRDKGLSKLTQMLVKEQRWVELEQPNQQKHLRVIWEGLFFMFWHADKSVYQRETALKISKIMEGMGSNEHKQQWFQACLYILNKHWDKVDNFRIDKFLALLRFMFTQALMYIKSTGYEASAVQWLQALIMKLFTDNCSAQGIALQICDVFIPELAKVDQNGVSLDQIGQLLMPFIRALARSNQTLLTDRIVEHVFDPLLENNVTMPDSDDSEEEDLTQVDGGKMSKGSRRAVNAIVNAKYVFPSFNILLFAENYIFPQASAKSITESPEDGIDEKNREQVYQLYYKALKLEPEPKHPELTFSQRQLMNRARKFITKKMAKRMELRATKKTKKDHLKARKLFSEQVMDQLRARMSAGQEQGGEDASVEDASVEKNIEEVVEKFAEKQKDLKKLTESKEQKEQPKQMAKKADTGNMVEDTADKPSVRFQAVKQADAGSTGSDEVLEIPMTKVRKHKKTKAQKRLAKVEREAALQSDGKRRVIFKTENNVTREFHKHSKVATRSLEISSAPKSILKSAIKKTREDKQSHKKTKKVMKFAQ